MTAFNQDTFTVVVVLGLLIGIIAISAIVKSIFSAKPPVTFRCARCRREVPHDNRTVEAWRSGKHKFFCQECHDKWRETHPAISLSGRGGCMLPLALVLSLFALGAYAMMGL